MQESLSSIGRYVVEDHIGRGGMGDVFLARDPTIDRPVALKLMRDGFDTAVRRQRFLIEARSAGRLRHPNIVTIFDVGEHEGRPFIAMEYIEGDTLAQKIWRRDQIPLDRKLRYMQELCAGLGYAHQHNVIHRDVKPANIMIDPDQDVVKILDFGIARLDDVSVTRSGVVVGSLNYMSPERYAPNSDVDQLSDVFAVGAVFYEMLAYRQAFPGSDLPSVMNSILNGVPEPLERLCPTLPSGVTRLVDRALEKDRRHRYATLVEMRAEIEELRQRIARDPAAGVAVRVTADLPTTEVPTPSAHALLDEASVLLQQGEIGKAQALIDRALAIAPTSERALTLRQASDIARAAINVTRGRDAEVQALLDTARRAQGEGRVEYALGQARRAATLGGGSLREEAMRLADALDSEVRRAWREEAAGQGREAGAELPARPQAAVTPAMPAWAPDPAALAPDRLATPFPPIPPPPRPRVAGPVSRRRFLLAFGGAGAVVLALLYVPIVMMQPGEVSQVAAGPAPTVTASGPDPFDPPPASPSPTAAATGGGSIPLATPTPAITRGVDGPTAETDLLAIRRVLDFYISAYQARSAVAVLQAFPDAPDRAALDKLFTEASSIILRLENVGVVLTGPDSARATARAIRQIDGAPASASSLRFDLRRRDADGWVITSIVSEDKSWTP